MAYLTGEQIDRLLEESRHSSAKDLEMIVRICLSTGARWGEAEKLKRSQISAGKVTFVKTKGKRNRTIPLDPEIIAELPKRTELFSAPVTMHSDLPLDGRGLNYQLDNLRMFLDTHLHHIS